MGKTTLRDVAKKLNINKSRLHYYVSIGLINPDLELSGMFLFEEDEIVARIKYIMKLKKIGMSLSEIKKTLNK